MDPDRHVQRLPEWMQPHFKLRHRVGLEHYEDIYACPPKHRWICPAECAPQPERSNKSVRHAMPRCQRSFQADAGRPPLWSSCSAAPGRTLSSPILQPDTPFANAFRVSQLVACAKGQQGFCRGQATSTSTPFTCSCPQPRSQCALQS